MRPIWSHERLIHERSVVLGCALDSSSVATYSSALNSYLAFCHDHNLPIELTVDTLTFYTVYASHFIKPKLVANYLSGICSQLEPFYPDVRQLHSHHLVKRTLQGCMKLRPSITRHKRPLTHAEIAELQPSFSTSTMPYDDKLFFALLTTGFHALMHLGELVWPDKKELQDSRKLIMRHTVEFLPAGYAFYLPGHKGDRFFDGSCILLQRTSTGDDPFSAFHAYVTARDITFPFHPQLWLRSNGSIPTRAWFIQKLLHLFKGDIGGHSLHASGATALAEAGIPPHLIQAIGRWSSPAFQIYIRRHSVLLAALLYSQPCPPNSS